MPAGSLLFIWIIRGKLTNIFCALSLLFQHRCLWRGQGNWSERAYEALGQDEKARASFEKAAQHSTAYYGQLAAEHMGGTVLSLPHPPKPDAGDKARFEAREAVRVMHLAGDMGQTQLFLLFLYQLDDELNTPEDLALSSCSADLAYEYAFASWCCACL